MNVNVTEKVARALAYLDPDEDWPTNEELGGGPTGTRDDEFRAGMLEEAQRALATLSDPEVLAGIAGVLAEHGDSRWSAAWSLLVCRCGEVVDDHAAHQAAAVVEWLRGRG